MATQLQIRRGTSSQVAAFTDAEGEIVVNTTNDSVHVNGGSTAGGFELARADLNNVSDTSLNAALSGNTLSALTITTLTLGSTAITASGAEINILDGVTSTTAELNILDGVTSTAAELNILDGVTATTAELNYVDGVTSAIQTQLDSKAPVASPTFTGTVTTAALSGTSATFTTTDTSDNLTLTSTDADAAVAPNLKMYRNSASPADSDQLGKITLMGRNDNSQDVDYGVIGSMIVDASDGSEDGRVFINTMVNGELQSRLDIRESELIINNESKDLDFRVESDGNTHALFVEGSSSNVGINASNPSRTFHSLGGSGISTVGKFEAGGTQVYIQLSHNGASDADSGYIGYDSSSNLTFFTDNTERMRISGGSVGIGTTSPSSYFSGATNLVLAGTGDSGLTVASGTSGTGRIHFADGTSGDARFRGYMVYNHSNDSMQFATSGTEVMRLTGGNVGIGATTVDHKLHLEQSDTTVCFTKTENTAGNLLVGVNSSGNSFVSAQTTGKPLILETQNTERARITDSGIFLVGKTASGTANTGAELRSGVSNHAIVATSSSEVPVIVNRRDNDGSLINLFRQQSHIGSIAGQQGSISIAGNPNTGGIYFNGGTDVRPWNQSANTNADNTLFLGSSNSRWEEFFCANDTINTSDRNEKQDIEELTEAEQRVAVAAKGLIRKYRWKSAVAEKGDDARIHFGIIAQDLQDAFTAEGLDARRYAMFCSDTWTNDDGSEQTRLGVRYSELLAFIIAAI